jgi:hypothetical protein
MKDNRLVCGFCGKFRSESDACSCGSSEFIPKWRKDLGILESAIKDFLINEKGKGE